MMVSAPPVTYYLYGLTLSSTMTFPELAALPPAPARSVMDLHFQTTDKILPPDSGPVVMTMTKPDGSLWLSCLKTVHGYRLCFPSLAEFAIDSTGRVITCAAGQDTPQETIRHLFLDQVLPLILNLQGHDALHASTVLTPSGACAFIGPTGRGKSTLAAVLHQRGYPVLSDDCLVLSHVHESIMAEPAYPGLRLWEDTLGTLADIRQDLEPVSHYNSKQRFPTPPLDTLARRSYPLVRIYSLIREDMTGSAAPRIQPLSLRDSVMELLSYAFRLDLTDHAMLHRQLQTFEQVAAHVPVKQLVLPNDLRLLPDACAALAEDLTSA